MRLLIVVNVDWFFLSHRLSLAKAAVDAGWEVHVATTLTESAKSMEGHGFTVHSIEMHRSSAGLALGQLFYDFVRLFRRVKPDVLHLVTIKPVLVGGLAARICGVRGVVYAISGLGHVFSAGGPIGRARRFVVRQLYRAALGVRNRRLIFQNELDKAEVSKVAGVDEGEAVMIPGSGFDVDSLDYAPLPSGPMKFLLAARLLKSKGIAEFCQAASQLSKDGLDCEFLLAGALDEVNPTGLRAEEVQAIENDGLVRVLGFQSDVPALMREVHVVVLPSYYGEGLPKVLIEAAAVGRAVITTDMPGCRDAIEPNVSGLLVPPRDAKALAASMKDLALNVSRVEAMGRAGRERAQRLFRIQDVEAVHLRIYRELLTSGR